MPERKGYRAERLRRRRRSSVERSQAWLLYVLAAAVAFAAVLGAWYLAGKYLGKSSAEEPAGYLAALQFTVPGSADPVAGALVVQDASGDAPAVYLVPPDLLLAGPNGEYVFAADAMASGTYAEDLSRVVGAPIDAVYTVPVADLVRWAGSSMVSIDLAKPVTVDLDAGPRTFKDGALVPVEDVPAIMAATGPDRRDTVELQSAVLAGLLQAAALRAGATPGALASASPSPAKGPSLAEVAAGLASGTAVVTPFPVGTRVAEGQFAFLPDPEKVMAEITRKAPGYRAGVTVQVKNGSGRVGAGEAAVERLSTLDVNLPAPLNADSFSYAQTQILATPETLQVARDIRAILGRGVVLDGTDLPPKTVVVIVGDDFKATSDQVKDQP